MVTAGDRLVSAPLPGAGAPTNALDGRDLERSEAQLRAVMETVGDAFVAMDADGVITSWSARSEEMFGWTDHEAIGRSLVETLIPERLRKVHGVGIARYLATEEGPILGQRTEVAALHKSGRELPVELTVWAVETEGRPVFSSFLRDISDRHAASHAVAEVNMFFDLTLDLLCIASLDGYFKRLNPAWTEVLGWSVEELTSRPFNDFVHPDDREKTAETVGDLATGALTYSFENRYRCKDGSYRWLMWNSRPLLETGSIYAIAHDITEQKRTGEDMAAIVQSTNDAIIGWSSDRHVTSWNPGAERMYGYPAEDMIGLPLAQAAGPLVPDDRRLETARLLTALERGEAISDYETVGIHRDGHLVDVSMTMSLLLDKGVPVGGSLIARDETRRKDAERERSAHNAMLQAVIANSQSLIYVKDLDGRYLLANEPFERAFDIRAEDLLGKTDEHLDPALAPVWRVNDLRAQHEAFHLDEWSDAADGRHHYESVKFPLHDAQGRVYATCGVSLDVTERRRAALALVEARDAAMAATAAKSSFLATMSHEIRTPMNAVIGMTGLLLDTVLDADQRDFVETVRDSGEALLSIINDVLDFSKIEAAQLNLERQSFDLEACVEGSLELLATAAAAKGLELACYVEEGTHHVVGDVTRVRQVLVNLLSNAIKFSDRGGVMVTVAAEHETGAEVRLRVAVSDTGIGIPAGSIADLFTSFSQVDASTTRRYGGTGLGLAISQRLVEAMGGEMAVESELGVGSTFSFSLTLGRDEGPAPAPEPSHARLRGRSALVMSQSREVRRALRLRLEAWGLACTEVDSAEDAVAAARDDPAVAVAVLDDDERSADGSVLLVSRLRALPHGPDVAVVVLSRIGAQPERRGGASTVILTKPVKRAALLEALSGPRTDGAQQRVTDRRTLDDASSTPLRVLLAEDNVINQKVGQLMLRKLGHRVDTVSNGREAVTAAHRQPYDVILMDLQMPEVDGLQATRAIRSELSRGRQPWIVAMTASVLVEDRDACQAAGMDDYLAKPVRQDLLAAALEAAPRLSID